MYLQKSFMAAAACSLLIVGAAHADPITEQAVIDAQTAWGEGIVAIATEHADGGDFGARAMQHIETLYAYGDTDVMSKPTLAAEDQFRETFDEAMSYLLIPKGLKIAAFLSKDGPRSIGENNGIYTNDDSAMAMGNYYFTGPHGNETKVEYTFGFVIDGAGQLKINLHHSLLPYSRS